MGLILWASGEGCALLKTWTETHAISWNFFLWNRVGPGPISQLTACSCTVKLLAFFFCYLALDVAYLKVCFKPWGILALRLTAATALPPIDSSTMGTPWSMEREVCYVLQFIKCPETPSICICKQKLAFNMCFYVLILDRPCAWKLTETKPPCC